MQNVQTIQIEATATTANMSEIARQVAEMAPQAQVEFKDGGPMRPDVIVINGKALNPGSMIEIHEDGQVVATTAFEMLNK